MSLPNDVETRAGVAVEYREDTNEIVVHGYAAIFGENADIGGAWIERITPGAFRNSLASDDVVFLVNHDGEPLARTGSGTLTLTEDARGLHIEARLDPSDPDVQRIIPKMRRGDMNKMSFAFSATRQTWDDAVDPPARIIDEVRLFDVSIVTRPAYSGTSIAMRSLEAARDERRQHPAQQRISARKAAMESRFRGV